MATQPQSRLTISAYEHWQEAPDMMRQATDMRNLYAAFERVEASKGMAGVDGVSIGMFRRELAWNLQGLACELADGRYLPLPLLQILVAKPNGSPRVLRVPTVRDRVAQAAVLEVVGPLFEAQFEDVSFAYRKGRSVKQAAYRIKELRDQGYLYVVEADIDSYFDSIDQELLEKRVQRVIEDPDLRRLLRLWVRAEVYDGQKVFTLETGIPQGSVVAPTLANLFLDDLDETLLACGHKLVRYSDDFVILAKTLPEAERALELTEEILESLHLALDVEDTSITHFSKGFKFLGLIFTEEAILAPFDRPPREKRVLYIPPPFDLAAYLAARGAQT
jgi:RNA-directed DNA polymerase